MRDFQRSRVYAWERSEFNWDDAMMTLDECQALVNEIDRRFAISLYPKVIVTDGRRCRKAYACSDGRIKLPRWARKKWVVLHEVAHLMAYGDKHGSKFLAYYLDLLTAYYNRNRDDLVGSAKDAGLQVAW